MNFQAHDGSPFLAEIIREEIGLMNQLEYFMHVSEHNIFLKLNVIYIYIYIYIFIYLFIYWEQQHKYYLHLHM